MDFKQLKVWEKAHQFTLRVYKITNNFPDNERYGLISQIRRAAASVPTNIAEGYGRSGQSERSHFLNIAIGSANEVEYQLILSKDLGYISEAEYSRCDEDIREIRKMLASLYKKIKMDLKESRK
jgi:four helix bundle protein